MVNYPCVSASYIRNIYYEMNRYPPRRLFFVIFYSTKEISLNYFIYLFLLSVCVWGYTIVGKNTRFLNFYFLKRPRFSFLNVGLAYVDGLVHGT